MGPACQVRCQAAGDVKDGTGCGTGKVCMGGNCVDQCGRIGKQCCPDGCREGFCQDSVCKAFVKKGGDCRDDAQCATGICDGNQFVCCSKRCGADSLCKPVVGDCKLLDGEQCSRPGASDCFNLCLGNCLTAGDKCLNNSDCPSGDVCLQDAPECGTK
jgi:hypothetical protein